MKKHQMQALADLFLIICFLFLAIRGILKDDWWIYGISLAGLILLNIKAFVIERMKR